MLYPGSKLVSREALNDIPVPTVEQLKVILTSKKGVVPKGAGKRWAPIQHGVLVGEIEGSIDRMGFEVIDAQFSTSEDGFDVIGAMALLVPDREAPEGVHYELGFRASNAQRHALFGFSGATVLACLNGIALGSFVFGQKHTTFKTRDLTVGIDEGMRRWAGQIADAGRVIDLLRATEVSDHRAESLMVRGARDGVYGWSKIAKIDAEYNARDGRAGEGLTVGTQRHEEFAPRTLWSLVNAATEVAKIGSPMVSERILRGFPVTISREYGFDSLIHDEAAETALLN